MSMGRVTCRTIERNTSNIRAAIQNTECLRVVTEALNATQGDTSNKSKLQDAIRAVEFDAPRGLFRFDPETQNVVVQNI